jgi:hypothetical protein
MKTSKLSAAAPAASRISGGAAVLRIRIAPSPYAAASVNNPPKREESRGGNCYKSTVSIRESSSGGATVPPPTTAAELCSLTRRNSTN